MAAAAKHHWQCSEVPLASAQRLWLFSVQPHEHHRGVCFERGAAGCGEDEEVPPKTGSLTNYSTSSGNPEHDT